MSTTPVTDPLEAGRVPMTDEELREIGKRAEAATAGPWYGELGEVFSDVDHWNWIPNHEYNGAQDNADAAFIADARTDVPRLLDEIERLRGTLEFALDNDRRQSERIAQLMQERRP